ncbi:MULTISPECIES: NAD(P)/FAD-dependent oxidoreductase [Paenibacillus]|uniref:FAD-dependent oxidoreductase n=1 Tax=Paenibacillus albilobatus TaxID=2716884 RepID=A0A919XDY7_9BACL|nr:MULTISPECIES: NAD(P)/FAD-dependent oxidoreductase [Paenibacillus]GIO29107.1 FAD-dependent oxidoreductase [Paenibacillus albilobatus]
MPDAIVIGGGPAGSSLAIRLAHRGWETQLFDRQRFPRHKACGEFLSPETLGMFRELGVYDQMEALQPGKITNARIVFRFGGVVEAKLERPAWGLSRYAMDKILLKAAEEAGVRVHTGTSVSSIASDAEGFRVGTRTGGMSAISYSRTAFAAWGVHPRADLADRSLDRRGKKAYIGLKAHISGIRLDASVELYFIHKGYIGISPVEGGKWNVAALLPLDGIRKKGSSVRELLQAAAAENRLLAERLHGGVLIPDTEVSTAPVYLSFKPQSWGIVPQIGDAGAMIPPLFGDGMSAALRSARRCADYGDLYLRGDIPMEAWKAGYLLDMQKEYAPILQWGRLLQTLANMPVVPRLFTACARLFPQLGPYVVQATRMGGKPPLSSGNDAYG